jgi:hypothetical protein
MFDPPTLTRVVSDVFRTSTSGLVATKISTRRFCARPSGLSDPSGIVL